MPLPVGLQARSPSVNARREGVPVVYFFLPCFLASAIAIATACSRVRPLRRNSAMFSAMTFLELPFLRGNRTNSLHLAAARTRQGGLVQTRLAREPSPFLRRQTATRSSGPSIIEEHVLKSLF